MIHDSIHEYNENVYTTFLKGDAREESYYQYLAKLVYDISVSIGYTAVSITTLPKKTDAGNPDFRVWDGESSVIGYIEAKDPIHNNLNTIEKSEQLQRYIATFPNVILTNFYEFRLYRNGKRFESVTLSKNYDVAFHLKAKPSVENEDKFYDFFRKFLSFNIPKIITAKELAKELAKRTRFLKDEVISTELNNIADKHQQKLNGFYEAFQKYLIHDLSVEQFADLYAQTITYGLFIARMRSKEDFNRKLAYNYIPQTIGILYDIFRFISLEETSDPMKVIIDDIAEVLRVTDVDTMLLNYNDHGEGNDPILHFYETFLSEYDPGLREKRGVYYTPQPVVKYIVDSVHIVLQSSFGLADGLASSNSNVTLLDPAAGTLTFPAEAAKKAVQYFITTYGDGGVSNYIKSHILKNFYAFELMMAPYAIGHLKMSFVFEEFGYILTNDERFKLYLTNSLEMEDYEGSQIPILSSLSEESHFAIQVKKDPILIIIGNPPYSGMSANTNKWTEKLLKENIDNLQSYYTVDGQPLGEKNPKWLQDDYVKFLRFAQWKINNTGMGIVGMITNHSYLDNPTFRGMRQSLMNTFNEMYILNLHGNSLKKEKTPDGKNDENVFDIKQGVAIAIFVKYKNKKGCRVFYKDLYGTRNDKYEWLNKNNYKTAKYKPIKPQSPYYLFIQRDTEKIKEYMNWKRIDEIFPINSVGIVTSRDEYVIDFKREEVSRRILQLRDKSLDTSLIAKTYNLKDKKNWKFCKARLEIQKLSDWEEYIKEILYRPFDSRYIFYHKSLVERTREDVMRHMMYDNVAINICRQVKVGKTWQHCFISNNITESCYISNRTSEIGYICPLYIYEEEPPVQKDFQMMMVFDAKKGYGNTRRKANISIDVINLLTKIYLEYPAPEEILYYIYALLYSTSYREKYRGYLAIDFPRIPFTSNYTLFKLMAQFGKKLTELHLLKSKQLNKPVVKFKGKGDNITITRIDYDSQKRCVYINNDKYFEGIKNDIWNYQIGGYQVLKKYLSERKGKNVDDPALFCKIATAIITTVAMQREIDAKYNEIEKTAL